jgi:hypothetical protein
MAYHHLPDYSVELVIDRPVKILPFSTACMVQFCDEQTLLSNYATKYEAESNKEHVSGLSQLESLECRNDNFCRRFVQVVHITYHHKEGSAVR